MDRSERKHVAWLYEQIPGLVKEGALTESQAEALRSKYGPVEKTNSLPIFVTIFGILGALLIGGGIILLIGHNWDEMGKPMRLFFSFMPLLMAQALGLWVWVNRSDSDAWKEGVATVQAIMIGASIALVSQTYNIGGSPPSFILTWMLLGLPLVYLFSSSVTAVLYLIASTSWVYSVWDWVWWHDSPFRRLLFWFWVALLIPYVISRFARPTVLRRDLALGWVLAIALLSSLGLVHPNFCYFTYPCMLCIFYFSSKLSVHFNPERQKGPFYWLGGFGLFAMTVVGGFKDFWPRRGQYVTTIMKDHSGQDIVVAAILLLILLGMLLYLWQNKVKCEYPVLFLPFFGFMAEVWAPDRLVMSIMVNFFALAWGIWILRRAFVTERMGLLNAGVSLICAMILSRFCDSDMDFVARAVAFIVVGCGFLGANWWMLSVRKERRAAA